MSSTDGSLFVEPVSCAHCGAALEVSPQSNFVTCRYCHQRLHVRRTPSSIFTEAAEQLVASANRLASSVDSMRVHQQIEQLDREFEMAWGKRVLRSTNTKTGFGVAAEFVGGLVAIVFLIVWTIGASFMFPPFALFGIGMLVVVVFQMANEINVRSRFEQARIEYLNQRRALSDGNAPDKGGGNASGDNDQLAFLYKQD